MERNSQGSAGRIEGPIEVSCEEALVSATTSSQDSSIMLLSVSAPTGGSSLQNQSLSDHKPTLLSIPQELRNRIFGYLYTTAGTVAKSIDLDLSSKRTRCVPGVCELTGYFYYLPKKIHPPSGTPLLICKQLHAEMRKMHGAAFRNYWTANTFKVELCNQSFGGSDHIAEKHLRHIHHIAYKSKRLCESLALHYIFQEGWTFVVELTDDGHPEGRMLSLSDLQEYWQFAELDKLSTFPARLEAAYRARTKVQLDPSIGQGFTFDELVFFLEALDEVFNSFDDLPRYCSVAAL